MYQVNMFGLAPAYFDDEAAAWKLYMYLRHYFTRCSIRKINQKKILKMIFKSNT